MIQYYPHTGIGKICGLFGRTRQAWYKYSSATNEQSLAEAIIVAHVKELRRQMPRLGGRKLQYMLRPLLEEHRISIGRDKLFDILADNGLLVRRRKRRAITTNSRHHYHRYPNLVKGMEITAADRLWVSDITYLRTGEEFSYLSLVTDAYSRKIVGYCLYATLKAEGPLQALDMALGQYSGKGQLIHHSDRGSQYCCHLYTELLQGKGISISMTEKGDPYENAIAERVNGILKDEFGLDRNFGSFAEALEAVEKAVLIYNNIRPHASCNYLTPQQAHQVTGMIKKRWKKKNLGGVNLFQDQRTMVYT